MKPDNPIDESDLHSVIDGEADADTVAEVFSHMHRDAELASRGCELAHTKDLVRMAYAGIEPPIARQRDKRRRWWAAAAVVVVGLATVVAGAVMRGWHANPVQRAVDADRVVLLDPDGSGRELADPRRVETRIVFQLANPTKAKADEVLDEIEGVLDLYSREHRQVRIEVVAHGEGLNHFRGRLSQHADRILSMARKYPTLTFVACRNTIERVNREQGFAVSILPGVEIIESGVNHVARRQAEGWAYIHL
ncbi:MAG: hypothetical protein ACPGUC_00420 [Gammaproteobacteria bacterium]